LNLCWPQLGANVLKFGVSLAANAAISCWFKQVLLWILRLHVWALGFSRFLYIPSGC
jgi:hypothetical protein